MPQEYWLRERGTRCYCPFKDGELTIGMNYLSNAPPGTGICVGEFWYDEGFHLHVELKPAYAAEQASKQFTRDREEEAVGREEGTDVPDEDR